MKTDQFQEPDNDQSRLMQEFGNRLLAALESSQLSGNKLAQQLGVSQAIVSGWTNAKRLPSISTLIQISRTLNRSIDWLLGLEESSQEETKEGLRWQITYPKPSPYRSSLENADIESGIDLFRRIIRDSQTIEEVRNDERDRTFASYNAADCTRLLRVALFSQHLRITNVERHPLLERELRQRFGLKQCIIANLDAIPTDPTIDGTIGAEAIAWVAAHDKEFIGSLRTRWPVGVTGGTPLSRFADLLQPDNLDLRGVNWLSLVGTKGPLPGSAIGTSANSLVARMVYRQADSEGYLMPFVSMERRVANDDDAQVAEQVLSIARKLKVACICIGSSSVNFPELALGLPEMNKLVEKIQKKYDDACVGDILLRLVDKSGVQVGDKKEKDENESFVYSITLEELREICSQGQVWVLAERREKAKVIVAGITAGYINSLLTSTVAAREILALTE